MRTVCGTQVRRTRDGRLGFAADYSTFLPAKLKYQSAFKSIVGVFEACNSSLVDVRRGVCIMAQCRGVGYRNVSLATELQFASMYVGGYPTRIDRILLVDVNYVVRLVLAGLLRALPSKIRRKFGLTSLHSLHDEHAEVGALPAFLGGPAAHETSNAAWWAQLRARREAWEAELVREYGPGFARL